MSSTEQVNVNGYIQTLREDDEVPDEELDKFAGWVPGSDCTKVYVHLTNDDVNRAISEQHGLQVCGQQNDQNRHECHNCKRSLSLENTER